MTYYTGTAKETEDIGALLAKGLDDAGCRSAYNARTNPERLKKVHTVAGHEFYRGLPNSFRFLAAVELPGIDVELQERKVVGWNGAFSVHGNADPAVQVFNETGRTFGVFHKTADIVFHFTEHVP